MEETYTSEAGNAEQPQDLPTFAIIVRVLQLVPRLKGELRRNVCTFERLVTCTDT
jgi:hypothetical protein